MSAHNFRDFYNDYSLNPSQVSRHGAHPLKLALGIE